MENRYQRQIQLPEIGVAGMQKLSDSSVLIIGIGGLGTQTAQYLTGSGIGRIGLMDFDSVELSNLHRQLLYREQNVGQLKTEIAQQQLSALNSEIKIETYPVKLDNATALSVFTDYDIIVDGTDSIQARYIINDACRLLRKPWIFGSVNGFSGQWAVMDHSNNGVDYRNLFPTPPNPLTVQNCTANGTIGPVPGITGTCQALEVIKYIVGLNKTKNTLFTFDMLNNEIYAVEIPLDVESEFVPETPEAFLGFSYDNYCFGVKMNAEHGK